MIQLFRTIILSVCIASLLLTCQAGPPTKPQAWVATDTLDAEEAHQAAAADEKFVYAITNTKVAKYDRLTKKRVAVSMGEAKHLNSGSLPKGKLSSAHPNYPQPPERSQTMARDPAT